ncbi:MAG: hypothetical protein HKO98_10695, partial [Gemmatimonadetes bacterium]|nr:hypothetical protein [Gemmatimonadota bacterium]
LVGSPLVGRFGLICDHPTTADYTVDFGDRNLGLVSYRCPRGFHLWEVQGRSGLAIDRISQIRCRRVDSRGQVETRTVRVSAGGLGGDAVYVRCSSANGFLRVTIFKNIAIDKLTWGCAVRS